MNIIRNGGRLTGLFSKEEYLAAKKNKLSEFDEYWAAINKRLRAYTVKPDVFPSKTKEPTNSKSGICTTKPNVFPSKATESLHIIEKKDYSRKIQILNKETQDAHIMINGAGGTPWYKVKLPPIYFHDIRTDILLGNNFIQTFAKYEQDNHKYILVFTTNCGHHIQVMRLVKAFNRIMPLHLRSKRGDVMADSKLTYPKMKDRRKFGKALLSFRLYGLNERKDQHCYEISKEEIQLLKKELQNKSRDNINKESLLSLENIKRLIQRNFNENPLAWGDKNMIEATLKVKRTMQVRVCSVQANPEEYGG